MLLQKLINSLEISLMQVEMLELGHWWNYQNISSLFTRLYYVPAGEAFITLGNQNFHLKTNSLFVIPAFIRHSYQCPNYLKLCSIHMTCNCKGCIDLFSLHKFTLLLEGSGNEEQLFLRLMELNPNRKLPTYDPQSPGYSRYHQQSEYPFPDESIEDIMETQAIMRMLLVPFVKTMKVVPETSSINTERVIKVLEYIEANLHAPIVLKSLSEIVGVHPTYLSDMFSRELGIRPIAFLNKKRVERSQLLLLTTHKSYKAIARECGFNNTSYFHRIFRKFTDMTPRQYQKQLI